MADSTSEGEGLGSDLRFCTLKSDVDPDFNYDDALAYYPRDIGLRGQFGSNLCASQVVTEATVTEASLGIFPARRVSQPDPLDSSRMNAPSLELSLIWFMILKILAIT